MSCTQPHHIRARHAVANSRCHALDPDCPHPQHESDTQLERRPMVDWLEPEQLLATGMKTVTAKAFGAYVDKREAQAAMTLPPPARSLYDVDYDYSCENGQKTGELWFDYMADLGDGFDATYTMARLVAKDVHVDERTLPRGRFLILGGDQVYPTASIDEYENRFLRPFQAANPWSRDPGHMYALPGNHDWYDGLTSFLRIFCQTRVAGEGGRWIGGWRTQQRRSYFALRLPHDWWIWGIDSWLESDFDRPQLDYFDRLAQTMIGEARKSGRDRSSQKIILITAEPNWVYRGDEKATKASCAYRPEDFDNLMWLENRLIRRNGFSLPLVIAGDLHHYMSYRSDDGGTYRVTCGGGGAYLMGTHQMPDAVCLPEGKTQTTVEQMPVRKYTVRKAYPTAEQSKRLSLGVLGLPLRSWPLCLLLGGVYGLLGWLAHYEKSLAILFALVVVAAFDQHTKRDARRYPRVMRLQGIVHGLLHVSLAIGAWYLARWVPVIGIAFAFVVGYILGSMLFAAYLLWSSRVTGAHTEEVFSSMAIADFKSFLRMHIDGDGKLRVYCVGVDKVPKDYEFRGDVKPDECGAPWFVSASGEVPKPQIVDEISIGGT